MNQSKKLLLLLAILCILFVILSKFVWAKNATDKIYPFYQKNLTTLNKTIPKRLASLKPHVNSSSVKDAMRLRNALMQLDKKRFEAAYSLLNKIKSKSVLYAYAVFFKSKTLIAQKDYKRALKYLKPIESPTKKIELDLFWLRQEALAKTKNKEKMTEEISALQKKRRKDKWVSIKGNYYYGLCELAKQNETKALEHFRKVVVNQPGTEFDEKIFKTYKIDSIKSNKLLSIPLWNQRAENLVENGFPLKALNIWQELYKHNKAYEQMVAHGFYKARIYKEAGEHYQQLLKNGNHKLSEDEIWYKIASSHTRQDNFKEAIKSCEHVLQNYPGTRAASILDFKLGFLQFDSENYTEASKYFEKYLNKGTSWQRNRARWFRLWSFYLTKNYDQTIKEIDIQFAKYKRNPFSDTYLGLEYWKARSLEKLNKKKESKELYHNIAKKDPLGYYGLLSEQRLKYKKLEKNTLINPSLLTFIPKNTKTKYTLPDLKKVKKDSLIAALLLYRLGLDNYAFDESRHSELTKDITKYKVAKLIEKAGNYNRGYSIRHKATKGELEGGTVAQGYELSFPRAYRSYVAPYTKAIGLDENLSYAVMRQESAFKPEALSYAFAYGLMQIIPPTGQEIANKIQFKDFATHDLNDPKVNTLFGSYYLKYLLEEFKGNLLYAIAAYNAGPDALKRWSKKAPNLEADEFVELIPYIETNKYVKKVLVNYLVYNRLY